MMTVAFFLCFYILAYLVGVWGDIILEKLGAEPSRLFRIAFGGCAIILTAVIVHTAGAAGLPPKACIIVTIACIIAFAAAGIFVKKRLAPGTGKKSPVLKSDLILYGVAIPVIVLQIIAVMSFRYTNSAAVGTVATATAVFEGNRAVFGEPMMVFTGALAALLRIHPLKLIFTVFPPVFITLYYLCYIELIKTVCAEKSRIVALVAVSLLNVWGYQSDVLIPATLLISWSGTLVYVIHGLLGVAAVIMIRYLEGRPDESDKCSEELYEDEDLSEEWDMKKHKIINARNLAIALGVLTLALICTVFVLNNKINRLYDATVNLQNDMNNRCSIYEFTDDEGNRAGYLVKGSDGQITFVGGGGKENAATLEAFFERYGTTVTQWYAYDKDEAASGAMRDLMDAAKVNVEKVYVIDREEITEE